MINHALSGSRFAARRRLACAMVAPMVSFRATLTHEPAAVSRRLDRRARVTYASMVANRSSRHRRARVLVVALAVGCGPLPGLPTVSTSDGSGGQGESTGPAASTGPGASGPVDNTTATTVPAACGDLLGEGEVTHPEPGYTVSGCFDDAAAFGCATCDEWCAAGGFGECVGGAPLDNCEDAHGQGYTVACDESFSKETAWKCVCKCDLGPLPACVACESNDQCGVGETCHCSTDFGPGQCLPDAWDQCAPPCDTTCLYYEGEWVCALPGC